MDRNNDSKFTVEFYAYNISSKGVVRKVYFFPTLLRGKHSITLSPDETSLLSEVLNNKNLVSFKSDTYTLCDLSFRGIEHAEHIGFSFKIIDDSNYINPCEIFQSFSDFKVNDFCNTLIQIQESLFTNKPKFNPFSMIGLLFDKTDIKAIKTYIRFDSNEVKTFSARKKLLEKVTNTINIESSNKELFLNTAEVIEKLGFQFSFVGVDCDCSGNKRFKIYFRTYERCEPLKAYTETKDLLTKLGLYNNLDDVFNEHFSGMWGFAVSTIDFTEICGVQLYFYP